jgi:hypothetical protein
MKENVLLESTLRLCSLMYLLLEELGLSKATARARSGLISVMVSLSIFTSADAQLLRSCYGKWLKQSTKSSPENPLVISSNVNDLFKSLLIELGVHFGTDKPLSAHFMVSKGVLCVKDKAAKRAFSERVGINTPLKKPSDN